MKNFKKTLCKSMILCVMALLCITILGGRASLETQAAAKKPAKVVLTSVQSNDYNAIKITWKKAANAKEYQVYRATALNGTYKLVKTTKSTSFINKELTTGRKYFYKVRGVNGTVKGAFSTKEFAVPTVRRVKGVQITSNNGTSVKLTWKAVNGAKGYKIYRSVSKNGTYKLIKTTTAKTFTNTGLTTGKTYFYKVRAYRTVNGNVKFGDYSKIVSYEVFKIKPIRDEMLAKVNAQRKKKGLPALKLYAPVNETAQIKAKDLYDTGVFDHYSANLGYFYDQYEAAGILYWAGGENIAYGQRSVSEVMTDWMNSPGHKANILGDYTHLGVGYYKGQWVQQFIYLR